MAQLLIWAVWSWLLWRLLRWAWGRVFGSAFARPAAPLYLAGEPRHLALALAHPAGFARVGKPYAEERRRALDGFEAAYVEGVLRANGDNVSRAARAAGLGRVYFYELLRKHNIR